MRVTPTSLSAVVLLGIGGTAGAANFYMGADISLLPFIEQQGGVFNSNGVVEPADEILYDAGANLFRLRLFVNPDTNYSDTDGAIQNLSYDLSLAQMLKADDPSAAFLLDLHYSDTWADPGQQTTPAAWSGDDLSQLESQVYNYTLSTLNSFKSAGVMPNMVQLGNEINNGILWPAGQLNFNGTTQQQDQSWANLGGLLNSAISAVRAVQNPAQPIQIALHIANGAQSGEPQYSFNNIQTLGGVTDFNIMGVSFYPDADDTLSGLQSNLTTLADTYPAKKIMVLETNYPYENLSGYSGWPETPAGQEEELEDVASVIQGLPNDAGQGVVYWYPEGIQVPNTYIYNGGATALFGQNGEALPSISDFSITANAWTDDDNNGSWSDPNNWSAGVVPSGATTAAIFGSTTGTTTITLNGNQTVGTLQFNNTNGYTLTAGTVVATSTLTMDNGGTAAAALISSASGANVISVPIVLNSVTQLNSASDSASLAISGNISSASGSSTGITITGAGFVALQGSNSYTGPTTVDSGSELKLQSAGAIPLASSIVNNGLLSVQYGNILGSPVQGPVVLGNITGSGTLGVGSNKNAYLQLASTAGTISQGTLAMMPNNPTAGLKAVLDLDGQNAQFNSIVNGSVGLCVIGNSGSSPSTLTISPGTAGFVNTFSGTIQDGINGTGSHVALNVGSGTLDLTGTNNYGGNTTVAGGADLLAGGAGSLSPTSTILNSGTVDVEANTSSGRIFGTAGALVIGASSAASLTLSPNSGISTVNSITIGNNSQLNSTNNELLIDYGIGNQSLISSIQSYLASGYAGGAWNGTGISSSAVANLNASQRQLIYSVGYADGADGLTSVSSGQIEIIPTLAGDAKIQGNVVFGDFQLLAQYFGSSGGWDEGNFTYGSMVDFGDFQLLAQNFGANSFGLTEAEVASLNGFAAQFGDKLVANSDGVGFQFVSVPEPASVLLMAAEGVALMARRRRASR